MIDYTTLQQRSFEVTEHDNMRCEPCKGAARHALDHYALGKLRLKIGQELGVQKGDAVAMPLADLLDRWHALKAQR